MENSKFLFPFSFLEDEESKFSKYSTRVGGSRASSLSYSPPLSSFVITASKKEVEEKGEGKGEKASYAHEGLYNIIFQK